MTTKVKLYKVLDANGHSCHGGSLAWSLPTADGPGAWHSVKGAIAKCSNGIHLTTEPFRWRVEGMRVFEAQARGRVGSVDEAAKIVCRSARLVRELTGPALAEVGIYTEGSHEASGSARVVARGSARVEAWDSARVEAWDSARVVARDSARVEAWGSARVEAWGSARVEAWGSARVVASGSARVEASGSARVVARGSARVEAWDSARVEAWDSARVVARDSARVEAWGSARVEAWGSATITILSGSPTITLHDNAVCIDRRGYKPLVTVA